MSAHDVDGLNSGYARLLLEDYLENPDAVPAEWRELFEAATASSSPRTRACCGLLETLERGNGHPAPPPAPAPTARRARGASSAERARPAAPAIDETLLGGVAAAMALVKAHRMHGHLAARLDPLGSEPLGDPALDETSLIPPLTPELQARIPAKLLRVHVPGETLAEALPALREVYTGTMAYEIEHLSDHARARLASAGDRVEPLPAAAERGRARPPARRRSRASRRSSSTSAARSSARSSSRSRACDTMVPMLDEAVEIAAGAGAHEVVIGMAHRGRLNVLVHTVGLSYESVLREFEGERTIDAVVTNDEGGTGRRQVPPLGDGHARDASRAR